MLVFDLLVLAELNPDVVVATDGMPAFGQAEQLVAQASITLGSSGAITASAAAAQGLRVAICGVLGTDAVGDLTMDLLQAQGIDTSAVLRSDTPTGMTIVLSRPDGDRALLTHLGAMSTLRATDVAADLVDATRHVHVSSYYLQSGLHTGLPALFADARARGRTTSLDPGWDPAQQWASVLDVLDEVDVFLPNAEECVRICTARTGEDVDALTAAAQLRTSQGTVVVKLGAAGAAVFAPNGAHVAHVAPVEPLDTTGAGDNFDAGYLVAMLDGAVPDEALRRAAASGAIAVTGWGGTGRHASHAEARAGAAGIRTERLDQVGVVST